MPSIKRSTRDLTRLDPRSDGNFSFGGRNWLYNNISLDGSYFNNPFGLDDPAPGGQANAEPVSMDAVEQVTVSIAPFDIREGGFTGAGINTVTKSGTNDFTATVYAYNRNESLVGNSIGGEEILASPDLNFSQTGLS
ncbi:MAG: TonB-dependent receptor, partial [bacterium]